MPTVWRGLCGFSYYSGAIQLALRPRATLIRFSNATAQAENVRFLGVNGLLGLKQNTSEPLVRRICRGPCAEGKTAPLDGVGGAEIE